MIIDPSRPISGGRDLYLDVDTNLEKLLLFNNQIEDLSPLLDLPELTRASFFFNPFDDDAAAVGLQAGGGGGAQIADDRHARQGERG